MTPAALRLRALILQRELRQVGMAAILAAVDQEIAEAVEAEREACAAYVEDFPRLLGYPVMTKNEPAYSRTARVLLDDLASRIRAR